MKEKKIDISKITKLGNIITPGHQTGKYKQTRESNVQQADESFQKKLSREAQKRYEENKIADPTERSWIEAEKNYTSGIQDAKKYDPRPRHINQDFINEQSFKNGKDEDLYEKQISTFYEPLYKKALKTNPELDRETFYAWMQSLLED